jgi:hypothetical protein
MVVFRLAGAGGGLVVGGGNAELPPHPNSVPVYPGILPSAACHVAG